MQTNNSTNNQDLAPITLKWDPKNLEIKTRSVERTLEPLVIQVRINPFCVAKDLSASWESENGTSFPFDDPLWCLCVGMYSFIACYIIWTYRPLCFDGRSFYVFRFDPQYI